MKFIKYIIPLLVLAVTASFWGEDAAMLNPVKPDNVSLESRNQKLLSPKREFRSAWITTFTNLDWPSKRGLSSKQQQDEFVTILNNLEKNGINSVIFQVRAASDAFYESKLSPWSEWLTGTQGKAPAPYYDPLKFMINECHKRNMEFHAWFNPFRAVSHVRFSSISKNHISKTNPNLCFKYGESKYFDPGKPEVRKHITDVVMEVVENYDIDGVHFDDYFYPYTIKGKALPDEKTYLAYKDTFGNIDDWRRFNINELVRNIGKDIKSKKPYVKFGVSPLAIWRNKRQDPTGSETNSSHSSFDNLYCDTKLWVEKGWVDYIAPQCYWANNNEYASYENLLNWWSVTNKDKHLYIGHAAYKMNKKLKRHYKIDELMSQIYKGRNKSNVHGSIYFRAKAFNANHQSFADSLKNRPYKYPSLIPTMRWIDSIPPKEPRILDVKNKEGGLSLTWKTPRIENESDTACYYVVYRFEKGEPYDLSNPEHIIKITRGLKYFDQEVKEGIKYVYYVTSADRLHNESELFAMKSIKRK